MARLKDLNRFFISEAKVSGTVPRDLMRLTQLQQLSIYGNRFSGSLPNEIINLPGLSSCAITGAADWLLGRNDDSNRFACPLPPGLPAACLESTSCNSPVQGWMVLAILVPAVLFGSICIFCGVRMRARSMRKKTKLLKEVTTTSATVMSDLSPTRSCSTSRWTSTSSSTPCCSTRFSKR